MAEVDENVLLENDLFCYRSDSRGNLIFPRNDRFECITACMVFQHLGLGLERSLQPRTPQIHKIEDGSD